jgi:AbrB family looped-hinge helix DNA binding protein
LTSKGQITIPLEIRRKLGLEPGTQVEFDVVGGAVRMRKAEQQDRGGILVARMREAGRRAGRPRLTTDQILALTRGE